MTRTRRHAVRRTAAVFALAAPVVMLCAAPAPAAVARPSGTIAFVADTVSGAQLFTVRTNGQGLRQLTHVEGGVSAPDWSPDGRTILYEHDLPDDQGSTLQVVNADGSHRRTLASAPGVFFGPASYTPDGKHVVYGRFDPVANVNGILSLDLSTGKRHTLIQQTGPGFAAPRISPDGHTLSFMVSLETTGNGLYTCALPCRHVNELISKESDLVDKHDWSPDGRHLASSENHDHFTPGISENVFTIRPDGTHLRYLTHFTGGDLNAVMGSYSPDGRWLAYRFESHGQYGLYRMDRNGHHRQAILPLSDLKPRYIDWGTP